MICHDENELRGFDHKKFKNPGIDISRSSSKYQ